MKQNYLEIGYKIGSNKCQYYNRTWECYEYQSVMKGCVYNLLQERLQMLINKYKEENSIGRLTAARREKFEKEVLTKDETYQILTELKKSLNNRW